MDDDGKTYTSSNTGATFSALAQEVRALAREIYSDFSELASMTEDIKNVRSEILSSSLNYGPVVDTLDDSDCEEIEN